MDRTAAALTDLRTCPVPVVDMLEGRSEPRSIAPTFEGGAYLDIIQRTHEARYAHEYLPPDVPP